jgi:hypothetical protein
MTHGKQQTRKTLLVLLAMLYVCQLPAFLMNERSELANASLINETSFKDGSEQTDRNFDFLRASKLSPKDLNATIVRRPLKHTLPLYGQNP